MAHHYVFSYGTNYTVTHHKIATLWAMLIFD